MSDDDNLIHTPFGMFPAAARFDDGEPVALLTGGPAMTVIGRQGGTSTLVAWFDAADVLHYALFPAAALYSLDDDDEEDDIGECAGTC